MGDITIDKVFSGAPEFIKQEILKFKLEIDNLEKGLLRESVFKLEKSYVKRKRFMGSPSLQNKTEERLINLRKAKSEWYGNTKLTEAIELALKLPIKKSIACQAETSEDRECLLKLIENNALIKNFDNNLKQELETIITEFYKLEKSRRTICFWGNPSTGKTSMAEELPTILKRPFYERTLQDPSEVNNENFAGSNLLNPNASPGWLAEA